jgi:hypothetical protein
MDEFKDQVYGKVSEDTDIFKRIASRVPGFSGYIERTKRRDSDKLVREVIFDRFRQLEGRVSKLQRDFIGQGQIAYVDDLESAAIKLRTFADRVRTATRGYSGLFDAVKVNEDELLKIYEYDAAMLDSTEAVSSAIDNVEASIGTDGLPAAIRNLETKAQECVDTFERREEVVFGA